MRNNLQFIRVIGFDNETNKIINKAIDIAIAENCGEVNNVHLFVAFMISSSIGKDVTRRIKKNVEYIYESYQLIANSGQYGHNINEEEMASMSSVDISMSQVINQTMMAIDGSRLVLPTDLYKSLLSIDDKKLNSYLEYINVTKNDIAIEIDKLTIPESIADFVENMNKAVDKSDETLYDTKQYTDEMVEVLSRKYESNPCLIGEAGVGKTSAVKAFVKRINSGDVPEWLKDAKVVYINAALLSANTAYRGAFEARMKKLLDWASENDVILFFDEVHTFINLGANNDSAETAGNMIKKYLSDGTIKIIGATTNREYHKYIEKDPAFSRRLQTITIKEPSVENAINMINNTITNYTDFHNISIDYDCIELAVKLSDRYIKDEALPAKAYKIIDQASTVAKINNEKALSCDRVYQTVSKITGIDVNKLSTSEMKQLMKLEDTLAKRLIGQDTAISTVAKAIRRSKAGVREENKPLASFMFVGPTGVGKTELCKILSNEVAVGGASLIKIDMSEYSEKHSISKMIGTAPGYVGYGEGGQLTEKVKHNPYSIILFDEIEKAHPDVFNIFLQILDEGKLTDGEGKTVDFTNCIIVLTSNAGYGADKLNSGTIGFGTVNDVENKDKEKIALEALRETFKPEFLNRLDNIVVFNALDKEQCESITKIMLNKLSDRLYNNSGIKVKFSKSVVKHITDVGYSEKYGARNIKRAIQNEIEDALADSIISGKYKSGDSVSMKYSKNNVELTKLA